MPSENLNENVLLFGNEVLEEELADFIEVVVYPMIEHDEKGEVLGQNLPGCSLGEAHHRQGILLIGLLRQDVYTLAFLVAA